MGTLDLFSAHGPAYLPAAILTAVAFMLGRTGVWLVRRPEPVRRSLSWGMALILWTLAAVFARAGWAALG